MAEDIQPSEELIQSTTKKAQNTNKSLEEIKATPNHINTTRLLPSQLLNALKAMSDRDKLFCIGYIQSNTLAEAAKICSANYSLSSTKASKEGNRMIKKAQIASFISIYTSFIEMQKNAICDRDELLFMYSSIVKNELSTTKDKLSAAKAIRELQGYDKPKEINKPAILFNLGSSLNKAAAGGSKLQDSDNDVIDVEKL